LAKEKGFEVHRVPGGDHLTLFIRFKAPVSKKPKAVHGNTASQNQGPVTHDDIHEGYPV